MLSYKYSRIKYRSINNNGYLNSAESNVCVVTGAWEYYKRVGLALSTRARIYLNCTAVSIVNVTEGKPREDLPVDFCGIGKR